MTAHQSRQSTPSAAAPASHELHPAISQAVREADEHFTKSISRCEALVARIDLIIVQGHQQLNRIRPAAEANIVQVTYLSTEHRKLLAARQWMLLLATDRLEETDKQLVELKTTILDVMTKAKSIVESLRSVGSVDKAAMDEFLKLVRSVAR
jgi:hypothetical protein